MDFSLLKRLQKTPAEDLHFVYGVNCYQFAIGNPLPIINRLFDGGSEYIEYACVYPGVPSVARTHSITQAPTPDDFVLNIIQGCTQDGLINCQDTPVYRSGYRTIALLIKLHENGQRKFDFQFTRMAEDGSCESKVPFRNVVKHENITALENDTNYFFHSYFLVPEKTTPQSVKTWNARNIVIKASDGKSVTVMEFKPDTLPTGSFLLGERVLITPGNEMAYSIRLKTMLVAPPWPPLSENNIVTDTKKVATRNDASLKKKKPAKTLVH